MKIKDLAIEILQEVELQIGAEMTPDMIAKISTMLLPYTLRENIIDDFLILCKLHH
jgi:hypothetical protein